MARSRSVEHPMPPEGAWIKYQLDLRNIKLKMVAEKANRSTSMVSHVICGNKNSARVEKALAEMLGYPNFEALKAAGRHSKGGAA